MISLLDYILCGLGIHHISKEAFVMDGELVHHCQGCQLIFQSRIRQEMDNLLLENLDRTEDAMSLRN